MSVTAKAIADFIGLPLSKKANVDISSVCTLGHLQSNCLTFLSIPTEARIAAIGARDDILVLVPEDTTISYPFLHIKCVNPRLFLSRVVAEFFYPSTLHEVSENSIIHPSAKIGNNVHIGHFTIIAENVVIGDDTYIGNNVEIFRNVKIGKHCHIKSQGVIGQQGFGFEKDEFQNYQRLPHIGSVILKDFIELGVHSTIAAGTIYPTHIGSYTKIDDHAHIGHNCQIGENNIIAGGVVVSGSITTKNHVWFGPNSSMMQGLTFNEGSIIGVGAVMYTNAKADTSYSARPALPVMKPRDN
ncbi:MAG: hypothetical protein JKY46_10640 [Robiginitomaculum sp.]|nr:hypothetical protein [Robiginitomaculum sp.]